MATSSPTSNGAATADSSEMSTSIDPKPLGVSARVRIGSMRKPTAFPTTDPNAKTAEEVVNRANPGAAATTSASSPSWSASVMGSAVVRTTAREWPSAARGVARRSRGGCASRRRAPLGQGGSFGQGGLGDGRRGICRPVVRGQVLRHLDEEQEHEEAESRAVREDVPAHRCLEEEVDEDDPRRPPCASAGQATCERKHHEPAEDRQPDGSVLGGDLQELVVRILLGIAEEAVAQHLVATRPGAEHRVL